MVYYIVNMGYHTDYCIVNENDIREFVEENHNVVDFESIKTDEELVGVKVFTDTKNKKYIVNEWCVTKEEYYGDHVKFGDAVKNSYHILTDTNAYQIRTDIAKIGRIRYYLYKDYDFKK